MWPDADPGSDVEGCSQNTGGEESLQELDVEGEVAKKGQVTVARIVSLVIVRLYPMRNLLGTLLNFFHDIIRMVLGHNARHSNQSCGRSRLAQINTSHAGRLRQLRWKAGAASHVSSRWSRMDPRVKYIRTIAMLKNFGFAAHV